MSSSLNYRYLAIFDTLGRVLFTYQGYRIPERLATLRTWIGGVSYEEAKAARVAVITGRRTDAPTANTLRSALFEHVYEHATLAERQLYVSALAADELPTEQRGVAISEYIAGVRETARRCEATHILCVAFHAEFGYETLAEKSRVAKYAADFERADIMFFLDSELVQPAPQLNTRRTDFYVFSEEQREAFRAANPGVDDAELPEMFVTDPLAHFVGARVGDWVHGPIPNTAGPDDQFHPYRVKAASTS